MSPRRGFPHLKAAAMRLEKQGGELTRSDLRALLCSDCDFYSDDHEEELECSCFTILGRLLTTQLISPEELAAALPDDEKEAG
jgi:hypothetical protein